MQSELITNIDGSIYHLQLHPQQLADTIILVGDPQRVAEVSRHFDYIEYKVSHREFVTHTGFVGAKRLSVVGTGIGTDNIDIVINELDALKNYDLITQKPTEIHTPLDFVRIGTSGAVQAHIDIDTFLFSDFAIGLDGLMGFYDYAPPAAAAQLHAQLQAHSPQLWQMCVPTATQASLIGFFEKNMMHGITATHAGFYAPQGRQLRYGLRQPNFINDLCSFEFGGLQVTNFEMETAGIYGLAHLLGHRACSLNAILANRITGEFSKNPQKSIENLIAHTLQIIEKI